MSNRDSFQFECCGVNKWEEWGDKVPAFKNGDKKVPESCCKGVVDDDKVESCTKEPESSKLKGCWTKFNDGLKNHRSAILGVSIAILILMVSLFFIIHSKNFNTSVEMQMTII